MMRVRTPLLAGAVLSLAAVAAIASQDPGPAAFPRMSIQHPLASYLALAAAPFGNGLELFVLVAVVYAACILIASRRHRRRQECRKARQLRRAEGHGQGGPVTPQPRAAGQGGPVTPQPWPAGQGEPVTPQPGARWAGSAASPLDAAGLSTVRRRGASP